MSSIVFMKAVRRLAPSRTIKRIGEAKVVTRGLQEEMHLFFLVISFLFGTLEDP